MLLLSHLASSASSCWFGSPALHWSARSFQSVLFLLFHDQHSFQRRPLCFVADKLRDGGHKPVRIAPSGDNHCGDHHNRAHQRHHHRGRGRKVQDEAGRHWRCKLNIYFSYLVASSASLELALQVASAFPESYKYKFIPSWPFSSSAAMEKLMALCAMNLAVLCLFLLIWLS